MRFKILFISFIVSSCYLSDELPPDQTVWEYDIPRNVNMSQDGLFNLDDNIRIENFQQLHGLIIIKDDKLVFENYYKKNSRQSINILGGASMAITVAAIGIALDQGILSLDDKIEEYLPDYTDLFETDDKRTLITIRHLLLNTSGIPWNNEDFFAMRSSDDWVRYVLNKTMQAPSGFQYNFNNATGIILAKIIENQSKQSYEDFVNINIFQPLSISKATIAQDSHGNYDGGFGIELSLIDLTKVGYLMLEEGIWNGRRIIDPNFVEDVTSIQVNVSGTYNSGFIWRRFGEDFQNTFAINHEDIYFITGELGQHLYIIPSKNMVIAMDAENYFSNFYNPSLNLLAEITYMIQ